MKKLFFIIENLSKKLDIARIITGIYAILAALLVKAVLLNNLGMFTTIYASTASSYLISMWGYLLVRKLLGYYNFTINDIFYTNKVPLYTLYIFIAMFIVPLFAFFTSILMIFTLIFMFISILITIPVLMTIILEIFPLIIIFIITLLRNIENKYRK